jgi:hypothetical protein
MPRQSGGERFRRKALEELTTRAASLEDVDLARADRLIAERLGTTILAHPDSA